MRPTCIPNQHVLCRRLIFSQITNKHVFFLHYECVAQYALSHTSFVLQITWNFFLPQLIFLKPEWVVVKIMNCLHSPLRAVFPVEQRFDVGGLEIWCVYPESHAETLQYAHALQIGLGKAYSCCSARSQPASREWTMCTAGPSDGFYSYIRFSSYVRL